MRYKVFSLEHTNYWKAVLDRLPIAQQDIYYTPEYYALFENIGDGEAKCFMYETEEGQLALYPFLLNSVNELGYKLDQEYFDIQGAYGYNGIVSNSTHIEFKRSFYACFDQYCQENNIIAEFIRFNPILNNQHFSENFTTTLFDRKTVSVDFTKDYEQIRRGYQRSTRKQINRMLNNPDIEVKYFNEFTASIIAEIYPIYLESMDRLKAKEELCFSASFFEDLFKIENTRLIVFQYKGKAVSFISFFHFEKKLHGFLGGTKNDYLTLSPFSLLYDYMIQYGTKHELDYLHVGGGSSRDKEDKLLSYKLHFSDQTNDFYIGKKIHFPEVYQNVIQQWEKKIYDPQQLRNKQLLKYRSLDNA